MSKIKMSELPDVFFWTGDVNITHAADRKILREDIMAAIERHCAGDWGDVGPEGQDANEESLEMGGRLFSEFHDRNGVKFWIIQHVYSTTVTVLVPDRSI